MKYMFLPFARMFDFRGRSRRLEYWLFAVLNWVIGLVFAIVFIALFAGKLFDIARRYGQSGVGRTAVERYGFGPEVAPYAEYLWLARIDANLLIRELGPLATSMAIAYLVYSAIVFLPNLSVTVRRLHDSNRTGWWLLIPTLLYAISILLVVIAVSAPASAVALGVAAGLVGMAAGLAWLVLIVFMFFNGTPGPNQFGPSPKAHLPPRPYYS